MRADYSLRTWRVPASIGALCAVLCAATTMMLSAGSAHAAGRIALVMGNGAYPQLPLRNPVNDARALANSLKELGFEVIQRENAGLSAMVDAMREFLDRGKEAQVRLVYFAGHGAQLRGKNFLIPIDAVLRGEDDLPLKTANVSELVDKLAKLEVGVNILILDACRDASFPLMARTRNPNAQRTLPIGFAESTRPPQGTIIAYSTSPGSVALDGPGSHSAYTRHLLAHMKEPGLPVEQVFKRVRDGVVRETDKKQVPWETSSLLGDFCFRRTPDGACPAISINPAQYRQPLAPLAASTGR